MCSWVKHQKQSKKQSIIEVPSIPQIQEALVAMQDKSMSFLSSKQWIGSVEVGLVVDYFYDVSTCTCIAQKEHHIRGKYNFHLEENS